jgi:8-oxo-dGTP pyrophosphatase MutT (NUDIX family)
MTKVLYGDRLGRLGKLRVGCSVAIFEAGRTQILLTRRTDNGQWCLPGGGMDPGESAAECAAREVREETGLEVQITRLVGVYSDPNRLIEYPDGKKVQIVAIHFEAEVTGGELGLSNETSEYGYFTLKQAEKLDMLHGHLARIHDTFAASGPAVFQ